MVHDDAQNTSASLYFLLFFFKARRVKLMQNFLNISKSYLKLEIEQKSIWSEYIYIWAY